MPFGDLAEREHCMELGSKLRISFGFYIGRLDGTADSMLKDGYRQALAGIKPDKQQGQKNRRAAVMSRHLT